MHGGGAERMAMHLLNHLDRAEFAVKIGLMRRSGAYLSELDPQHLDWARWGEKFLDYDKGNAASYRPRRLLAGAGLIPANFVAILRRQRPHVVISFLKGSSVCTRIAVALYGRSKVRWIAREGNNPYAVLEDELQQPMARAFIERLVGHTYRSADAVVAISHGLAGTLQSGLKVPGSRLRTIPNAVDITKVQALALAEPAWLPNRPFVIGVGRLERQKGFDVLIRAYAASATRTTHDLVIIGEGNERTALENLIQNLNLQGQVHLPGFMDNPWAHMARSSAFVLSSLWEGFGNVVIEAMACGTPVIVTDCDYGPSEVAANGSFGLVIPRNSELALTAALDTLSLDGDLRSQLIDKGLQRAKDYDVTHVVQQYAALIRSLIPALLDAPSSR